MKSTFLLHTCCAVCSGYVIQKLTQDFDVTAYFYNPNIHPEEEYLKRREVLQNYCKKNQIKFIEGEYNPDFWLEKIKTEWQAKGAELPRGSSAPWEDEPEGGERCKVCYKVRLAEAARKARELKCDYFGSTLTISPHKKADIINPIGQKLGEQFGVKFYERDWKKQDGFKKANEISRDEHFYRQSYCGCVYSIYLPSC